MSARFDAARRASGPEMMDAPDVDAATMAACLADLERVNDLTLGRRAALAFVARAARARPGRRLRVLDVGCGEGGTLRALAAWGRRGGVALDLEGVDLSPQAIGAARAATPADLQIRYRAGDVFADDGEPVDVVVSTLVAHHLDDADVARFLRLMEARARVGFLVDDLERSRFAYHGFALLARLMRWHPFVRHDGPLSIARGFTVADWRRLVALAGLADVASIRRRFPFRIVVERLKEAA